MKKIKYLVLILIVLLFSGCSGDYNLTFNKDLSITEELDVYIDNDSNNYERTYQLLEQADISEDDYEVVIIDNEIRIKLKKDYTSFEDYYLNSSLYRVLFDNIEFNKDNKGMSVNAESYLKLDDKNTQNIINSYDIKELNINIKIPFEMNKNNADSIKDKIYTWTLNKNDTYKKINFKYSYKVDNVKSIITLLLIGIASIIIIIYLVRYIVNNNRI